ncbi:hypothetical protein SteCoe_17042 [Stentor coeruleus]|uniref:Uncharacterized protein n=1 Tax=Stentor coeruleus TaxID=5963 RepID=A0A1R2BZN9_9CILI|nr:hypothetical protein SteCoe_17042 [Stentor coeruleus]
MSNSSVTILTRIRCKSRESIKNSTDISGIISSKHKQQPLIQRIKSQSSPAKASYSQQYSLPNLKTLNKQKLSLNTLSSSEESKLKTKIAQDLIIKRTESLVAYRIRLRALLDGEFASQTDKFIIKNSTSLGQTPNIAELQISPLQGKSKYPLLKRPLNFLNKKPARNFKALNDAYYFVNIFQSGKFASFYSLLNIFTENTNSYPYCMRTKEPPKPEIPIISNGEIPKDWVKCTCHQGLIDTSEDLSLKKIPLVEKIQEFYPFATPIFFKLQNVSCITKAIIINFESIYEEKTSSISSAVKKALKLLNGCFHLVFVTNNPTNLTTILLQSEVENLNISGVYKIANNTSKRICYLDYSQIFLDFQCSNPRKDCLIVSNHNIFDYKEQFTEDMIGYKIGTTIKVNIEKAPIISYEFDIQPITILLPNPNYPWKFSFFVEFAEDLSEYILENYYFRNTCDFESILESKNYNIVSSSLIYQAIFLNLDYLGSNNNISNKEQCLIHYAKNKKDQDNSRCNLFIF